jgi:hypothetical protein
MDWNFPTQIGDGWCDGRTDRDVVRPVGTDTTGTVWVRLAVPQPLARELANRWVGNTGYIEVDKTRATEILRSGGEAWRSLNPAEVRRLTPDLLPPEPEPAPEPEPGSWLEYRQQVAIKRASWLPKRQRIEAELRRDPARTDVLISKQLGSARTVVRMLRAKLEMAGEIKRIKPDRRATRPRPKFYKKRVRS